MKEILKISHQSGLLVIEDCAHSLGALKKDKRVGTLGDTAFFSFGRDKIISSVFGGMLITNNKTIAADIQKNYQNLKFPSRLWVLQQLLHPILFNLAILPTYNLQVGKVFLAAFQKAKILSRAVEEKEKQGRKPNCFPKRLPNSLALLALNQLKKLKEFNHHRLQLAKIYEEGLKSLNGCKLLKVDQKVKPVFLRYPLLTPKAKKILKVAKKAGIILGNWYNQPVAPEGTDLEKVGYQRGSCPKAEKVCQEILNLPTGPNISEKDVQVILKLLKKHIL